MSLEPVLVGLSGGVDSSAALIILKRRGYPVYGASLIFTPGKTNRCCNEESIRRAELLCSKLGVRHYTINTSKEFEKLIINPFVQEYRRGFTPNPCMICNPLIKWHYLLAFANKLGIPKLATGHYARIINLNGKWRLLRGTDKQKDQSYFLAMLNPNMLERTIFPLGELTKKQAKEIVSEFDDIIIPAESQEVCFVQDGKLHEFLASRGVPINEGPTFDKDGNILGTHREVVFTIGKRHHLGVAKGKKMYVVKLLPEISGIVVHTDAYGKSLIATELNWFDKPASYPFKTTAQIRYRHPPASCSLYEMGENVKVVFDKPQWAITPGQYVVFYDNDMVLGCGKIIEAETC